MATKQDIELRKWCLQRAIESAAPATGWLILVNQAQQFEGYVRGPGVRSTRAKAKQEITDLGSVAAGKLRVAMNGTRRRGRPPRVVTVPIAVAGKKKRGRPAKGA